MLTDFQNYFTTEKGIKFPTNPAIFHYILNMFPQFIRIGLFSTNKYMRFLFYGTRCTARPTQKPTFWRLRQHEEGKNDQHSAYAFLFTTDCSP